MLASGPSCPRFDAQHSQKISEEKVVDVAEVNQLHCLEQSDQWLENGDRTNLVLDCGKLVLQKNKANDPGADPSDGLKIRWPDNCVETQFELSC